jgi:hypothetical protein
MKRSNEFSNVILPSAGMGEFQAVPAATTNGAPLFAKRPELCTGARFYLNDGDELTYTIAAAQPTAPPRTFTLAGPCVFDEPLDSLNLGGVNLTPYITGKTGDPSFRYM